MKHSFYFYCSTNYPTSTFHVIQGVSQHFKDGHIQRITEGLVEQIRRWIHL